MYADLHCHTIYSDGNSELEEVIALAKEKGIKKLAITDHDTIFHLDKAIEIGKKYGVDIIRGVEMSCYDFDVNKKIHVVGLFLNEKSPNVQALCENTLRCRDNFHRKMIEGFQAKGFDITYEDAKKYSPYNIVYKMHIFMALVEKYKDKIDVKKFYKENFILDNNIDIDRQMGYIDIKEGIAAIIKDGGIPIIAHPSEYQNFPELEKYIGFGAQGVEISHPAMNEEAVNTALDFASRFDLYKSGGSDYHGGKRLPMGMELGCNGLTQEQFEEMEAKKWN